MTINEEAIIAGAKAMDAYWGGRYGPDEVEELRGEVTAMLEAAAPIIRAERLDEAADALADVSSLNTSGAISDWLRARAAAERTE